MTMKRRPPKPSPLDYTLGPPYREHLSASTASEIFYEYEFMRHDLYKCQSHVSENDGKVRLEVLRSFVKDNCPVMRQRGYATDENLQVIIDEHKPADGSRPAWPTMLTRAFIGRRWRFGKNTIDVNIKRGRKKARETASKQGVSLEQAAKINAGVSHSR